MNDNVLLFSRALEIPIGLTASLVLFFLVMEIIVDITLPSYAQSGPENAGGESGQYSLYVRYADNEAEPHVLLVDSGTKYTLIQSHSWVRDETSRYNLVSYSIDNGDYIEIPRRARGNFILEILMDSPHTVTFISVVQFPMSLNGNNLDDVEFQFSPPSPTGDNWFDANSNISVSVRAKAEQTSTVTTSVQVASWSIDGSTREASVGRYDGSLGIFTTPVIKVTGPHIIVFSAKTQHYVDTISPYGIVKGGGWYDEGATANVIMRPSENEGLLVRHTFSGWEGDVSSNDYSLSVFVDSPKTIIATWTSDYTQLVIVMGIAATAAISGGLTMIYKKKRAPMPSSAAIKTHKDIYETQPQRTTTATAATTLMAVLPSSSSSATQTAEKQENRAGKETPTVNPSNDNHIGNDYSKEIMAYALQKSIEKLEMLRTSGLVPDSKFPEIKQELEETFE